MAKTIKTVKISAKLWEKIFPIAQKEKIYVGTEIIKKKEKIYLEFEISKHETIYIDLEKQQVIKIQTDKETEPYSNVFDNQDLYLYLDKGLYHIGKIQSKLDKYIILTRKNKNYIKRATLQALAIYTVLRTEGIYITNKIAAKLTGISARALENAKKKYEKQLVKSNPEFRKPRGP